MADVCAVMVPGGEVASAGAQQQLVAWGDNLLCIDAGSHESVEHFKLLLQVCGGLQVPQSLLVWRQAGGPVRA